MKTRQEEAVRHADGGRPWCPASPPTVRRAADSALTQIDPAQRVLKSLAECLEHDAYVYQQPLASRTGAWTNVTGRPRLMLSSYDYLGLVGHPQIEAEAIAAIERYGTGTGGVRLLAGTTDLHCRLESELAEFKGTGGALTFTSGYLANLAVVSSLFGPRDRVVADEHAHRSLIDACRMARVPVRRFSHDDPVSLEAELKRRPRGSRCLVIAEGVYSMDGDICALPEIIELKRRYQAFLMVDESHSLGVLGRSGRGVDEHYGVVPGDVDLWTGSLSKAIPSNGGFVAGAVELMLYLQHAAAPFIFSSASAPASVAAACAALRIARDEPERREKATRNAGRLRRGLSRLGYDVGGSTTPIVPVIVGSDARAFGLARALFDRGVLATPIVHPAVRAGTSRLRLCATAAHEDRDIDRALAVFRALLPSGNSA